METLFAKLLLLLSVLNLPNIINAQATEPFTISGNVYSLVDSHPLAGIDVQFLFQTKKTDKNGFFKFEGFVEEYEDQKMKFVFIDKREAKKIKYKTKDTLINIQTQHLTIYLEELKSD